MSNKKNNFLTKFLWEIRVIHIIVENFIHRWKTLIHQLWKTQTLIVNKGFYMWKTMWITRWKTFLGNIYPQGFPHFIVEK